MQKIVVTREFKHMDLWAHQARAYPPATYTVVDRPSEAWECSPRCAEVALAEGWAKPAEAEKGEARPTGIPIGGEKPSASSAPVRRSTKGKRSK